MSDLNRRDAIKLFAAAPLAHFAIDAGMVERATNSAWDALDALHSRGQQYKPKSFTADEWRTVRVLADLVIPRDAHSGSATDAGVPEFMDFILGERESMRTWMRDGLRWLDAESRRRNDKKFAAATAAEQKALLDDIAYPRRAPSGMEDGVRFFSRFRDFTASGFWSSRVGVQDIGYMGNRPQSQWTGCPPAALRKLGLSGD